MEFYDKCEWISGWIHDYYCDKDGSELIFDWKNDKYFECPICGYKYIDEKRKKAWITKYRYKVFTLLENYSKDYIENKDEEKLNFIKAALNFYTTNYEKFKIHNKNGEFFDDEIKDSNKCGKITAQGLNEAMISIQIVNCINNINQYLSNETKEKIYNLLFIPMYKLLKPQVDKIHNICCYEICAIAMMGIISKNKEMLEFAFNSNYSFYKQLTNGLTKEFIWYEGSFHYHFFVLKPILELLKLAKNQNFKIPEKYYNISKKMLTQGFKCSFSDCSLPSQNDGWPNKKLSDYIEVYELANEIFNNDFSDIIKSINNKINKTSTIHLINSGFSLLKNDYWNVFIKYKDNDINHAHPDKLNIEIKTENNFLTHDLSTSGYGSDITKEYYKKTYSHNTIIINGKNQNLECESTINFYNENEINIMTKNIYDDVKISRRIKLISKKIIDEVKVKNENDEVIDYIFHCDAKLITDLNYETIEELKEYPYLKNIKKINFKNNSITLKWKLKNKIIINKINLKNKKLYICDSPDNPNTKSRTTLLIRNFDKDKKIFELVWEIIERETKR